MRPAQGQLATKPKRTEWELGIQRAVEPFVPHVHAHCIGDLMTSQPVVGPQQAGVPPGVVCPPRFVLYPGLEGRSGGGIPQREQPSGADVLESLTLAMAMDHDWCSNL